jgi:uroporphyrinogen decarboxylase
VRESARGKEGFWRFGGAWCSFFHTTADFFGMENYFVKMYTDPVVVHAVTRHVVDFYLAVNERMFREGLELFDVFFFGNDFGTQRDVMLSPDLFRQFVLPYFLELIAQAKRYGKPVQLHSCGAIARVIPLLIDAGIDALHPLQARAEGMQAEKLARDFKDKLVFVGGVDTQELLCFGTPQQVRDEVARLRDIFGPRWIISPSHECILPEVPMQNIVALCEAATGKKLT